MQTSVSYQVYVAPHSRLWHTRTQKATAKEHSRTETETESVRHRCRVNHHTPSGLSTFDLCFAKPRGLLHSSRALARTLQRTHHI